MPRRSTRYEQRVAADMEAMFLRLGRNISLLVDELRDTQHDSRRKTILRWLSSNERVAAVVLDELTALLGDLVSAAERGPLG